MESLTAFKNVALQYIFEGIQFMCGILGTKKGSKDILNYVLNIIRHENRDIVHFLTNELKHWSWTGQQNKNT